MYPISRIHDIYELEVFLFGGEPESPEPIYGRDGYGSSGGRTTRVGGEKKRHHTKFDDETIIVETIHFNLNTGELTFENRLGIAEKPK